MILIFGGVYQGKLAYALNRFGLTDSDVYHCRENDPAVPKDKKIFYDLDKWILALIKTGADVNLSLEQFIKTNNDAVIICNDISCGVVPVDAIFREWREVMGRSLAELSQQASEVVRLFCGIPSRLK